MKVRPPSQPYPHPTTTPTTTSRDTGVSKLTLPVYRPLFPSTREGGRPSPIHVFARPSRPFRFRCTLTFRYTLHRYPGLLRHPFPSPVRLPTGTPDWVTSRDNQSVLDGHVLDTTLEGPVDSDVKFLRTGLTPGPSPLVWFPTSPS